MISAYICGNEAEILRKDPYAVEQTLGQLDTMLPGAKASFKSGRVSDWISEPYSGGGFPYLPPNYALGPMSALFGPDRRIHFAGDATTLRMGFVEGALESAERAVQEVLNA